MISRKLDLDLDLDYLDLLDLDLDLDAYTLELAHVLLLKAAGIKL